MPFSSTSSEHKTQYWDIFFSTFIKPIVERVGYSCKRSSAEPGNIIKGVVKELIDSDVVLAVLTDYNPNVWYELGIRHASRKGTIMMIEKGQKLPFDISQYGVIEYDDRITAATIFEENLRKFIYKIESEKPIDSPALDFPEIQKKNEIIKQTEVDLNKAYEDKLEKIYELIVKLQEDKASSTITSKGATKYDIRNTKILWVDDNPSNNGAIMDVYRLQGVWFDIALNTSQALDLLASNEYNLIISDMGRGQERDAGLELIRRIKAQYSSFPPIFIFASHQAIEKFGEEAKKEGARLVTSSLQEMILNMNKVLYDKALVS